MRRSLRGGKRPERLKKLFSEFSTVDLEADAAAKKRVDEIVKYAASTSAEMTIATPEMYVSMHVFATEILRPPRLQTNTIIRPFHEKPGCARSWKAPGRSARETPSPPRSLWNTRCG